ncbi:hypothetical protein BAUCODRAFT_128283 [Baudoinia panamericana UAMH 10762]|uniref:Uncharacterized protein n=1 Tax=Baudoinia panamericana (strain UAMH 10762) TaxID=717646 RepID=M2LXN5_BAUPA|nr:uncharacterized protein BAUCODRAFT_128283 [Baudoinia panamericana UAMH 10762]EMC99452.1 hypothetical protein BAUCODRAFT_128283 [Baudoinia panamericana UAMH 10762]
MCFFDMYKFSCGDWKWGNFRQHCQREYRTGETCGTKLVFQTINQPEKCQFCERIERKQRRYEKAASDVKRWQCEPQKYRCSIEKAMTDMSTLAQEIASIVNEKNARYVNIGNTRRNGHR